MESAVQEPAIELKSWAFPHIVDTTQELAQRGKVDLEDPDMLIKTANTQAWGITEVAAREGEALGALIPSADEILERIPKRVRERIEALLDLQLMKSDLEATLRSIEASTDAFGYGWLEKRSATARFLFTLSCKIQHHQYNAGAYNRLSDEGGDRKAAEELLSSLYGYGWEKNDAKLQEAIERFELQLGLFWCTQVLGIINKYNLDPSKLTKNGLGKYGIPDQEGTIACYWDGGCPCMCGGRWDKMEFERAERTDEDVLRYGSPEMDRYMWVCYGGSRNSAFSPLMGVVRALSEGGGERSFVEILISLGSSLEGYRQKMGSLFDRTRHVQDREKKLEKALKRFRNVHQLDDEVKIDVDTMTRIEESVLQESLYSEAADSAISWPCLVAQAFGLNFTRSIKRALEHMAKASQTTLITPSDLSRTVPIES